MGGYKAFMTMANRERENFRLAYTTDKELLDAHGRDAVVLFHSERKTHPKFDTPSHKTFEVDDATALRTWVYDHALPLVGQATKDNMGRYQHAGLPLVRVFFDTDYRKENLKHTNYFANRVRKVARDF